MKAVDNWFLPVQDLVEAKAFYAKIGLNKGFDFPEKGMVSFRANTGEAAIVLKDKQKYPSAKPALWFVVDDVRQTYASLMALGVTFNSEPFNIGTGLAAEFEDPSGNLLGITDYSGRK